MPERLELGQQCGPLAQLDVEQVGSVEASDRVLRRCRAFLRENEHIAQAIRRHFVEIFDNPNDAANLELELAAFVDGGTYL